MKIANKISLAFLATVLVLTTAAIAVIYPIVRNSSQEAVFARLKITSQSRARHIETMLETQKDRLTQLSQSVIFQEFLCLDNKGLGYVELYNKAVHRLQKTQSAAQHIKRAFILNPEGEIVASSDERKIGLDKSTDVYFLRGKFAPYIKDAYLSEEGDKLFAVSAPVINDVTKDLLGVVVALFSMDVLNKITMDRTGLGQTGEIYLVNRSGYFITPSRFIKEVFLRQKIDNENIRQALIHELNGTGNDPKAHIVLRYKNYKGIEVLGVHYHAKEKGWILLAEISEKEVMAPLLQLKILFASMLVVTPLMAWLLGIVIARFIAGQIQELHKGAEIIGSGNLDYEIGMQTSDEIGQLSRAFDKMTKNLRETSVSRDYVDNIIRTMTDSLVVMDPEGIITTVNRATCDLLGYHEEELIGKDTSFLFSEEKTSLNGIKLAKLIRENMLVNRETNYVAKDGSKIPVLLSGAIMNSKEGDMTNIVCVAKDITESKKAKDEVERKSLEMEVTNRNLIDNETALKNMMLDMKKAHDNLKKAQSQLIQSEKMASVGYLAAGVAHEINNPLGYIINNLITLEKYINRSLRIMSMYDGLKDALARRDIEKAIKTDGQILIAEKEMNMRYMRGDIGSLIAETLDGTKRIESIVLDLKMFSREGGKEKRAADINKILKRVVNIARNEIKYTAELKEEYGKIPEIMCDEQHLAQVFINLLINASHAIKNQKGAISIRTYCQEARVCVEIADNGEGIPEDILGKIFDPFFTTNEPGAGAGLGLSVSHTIIEKHGGTIQVDSTVGKGTRFLISLPTDAV